MACAQYSDISRSEVEVTKNQRSFHELMDQYEINIYHIGELPFGVY
jgi:hypothetical protein